MICTGLSLYMMALNGYHFLDMRLIRYASFANVLCGCTTCVVTEDSTLSLMHCCCYLKMLNKLKQRVSHCHSPLYVANYVASPVPDHEIFIEAI